MMMTARQALRGVGWLVSELIPPRIPQHSTLDNWLADAEAEIDAWEPPDSPDGTCRPSGPEDTLPLPTHLEGGGGPTGNGCHLPPVGQPTFNTPTQAVDLAADDDGWWMPNTGTPVPFRGGVADKWGVIVGRFDTLAQAEHVAAAINSQLDGDGGLLDGDLTWAAGVVKAYAALTPNISAVERAQLRALADRLTTT